MFSDDRYSIVELANMADVSLRPDGEDTAGAKFLRRVADDTVERWNYTDPDERSLDAFERDGTAQEIADGSVPVYSGQLWDTFTELGAWMEDVTEFGPIESMDKGAHVALFMIAERLAGAVLEDLASDSTAS